MSSQHRPDPGLALFHKARAIFLNQDSKAFPLFVTALQQGLNLGLLSDGEKVNTALWLYDEGRFAEALELLNRIRNPNFKSKDVKKSEHKVDPNDYVQQMLKIAQELYDNDDEFMAGCIYAHLHNKKSRLFSRDDLRRYADCLLYHINTGTNRFDALNILGALIDKKPEAEDYYALARALLAAPPEERDYQGILICLQGGLNILQEAPDYKAGSELENALNETLEATIATLEAEDKKLGVKSL